MAFLNMSLLWKITGNDVVGEIILTLVTYGLFFHAIHKLQKDKKVFVSLLARNHIVSKISPSLLTLFESLQRLLYFAIGWTFIFHFLNL